MTEYVLQKKLLGRWDYVTWYSEDELDKAQRSFENMTKSNTGYSWRIVKLEVLEEKLLSDPMPVSSPEHDEDDVPVVEKKSEGWGKPVTPLSGDGWRKAPTFSSTPSINKEHGLSGKVWLANRDLGQKKRVDPAEVDAMLKQGWFKAGPRTVL